MFFMNLGDDVGEKAENRPLPFLVIHAGRSKLTNRLRKVLQGVFKVTLKRVLGIILKNGPYRLNVFLVGS